MEITKENKIRQTLKFELQEKERKEFEEHIKKFFEEKTKHCIEGIIDRLDVTILKLKDKLKLIENKNIKSK